MKIWLDDIRPAPDGYVWCRSVNEVIGVISNTNDKIELIDCDHDLANMREMVETGLSCLIGWQNMTFL